MLLKPGMKVRIRTYKIRPAGWNNEGLMDKWMGKIMTVRTVGPNKVWFEEDRGCRPYQAGGWTWSHSDIKEIVSTDVRENPNRAFLIKRMKGRRL